MEEFAPRERRLALDLEGYVPPLLAGFLSWHGCALSADEIYPVLRLRRSVLGGHEARAFHAGHDHHDSHEPVQVRVHAAAPDDPRIWANLGADHLSRLVRLGDR